jgi:hypothetical protein
MTANEQSQDQTEHDWKLWVPMQDGTRRDYRQCRDCGLIQTRETRHENPMKVEVVR